MWVMKCQEKDCGLPATWKAGTWWFCDHHVRHYGIGAKEFDEGQGCTSFGTTVRLRQLATRAELSRSYFVGFIPDDIWVEVESAKLANQEVLYSPMEHDGGGSCCMCRLCIWARYQIQQGKMVVKQ